MFMTTAKLFYSAFLLIGVCQADSPKAADTPWTKAKIQIKDSVLTLPVADTPDKSELGLMGRANVAEDDGMIFPVHARSIWMKDCLTDLDIIFVSQPPYGQLSEWKVDYIVTASRPSPDSSDDTLPLYLPSGIHSQSEVNNAFRADGKDSFCGNENTYRLFGSPGLVIELKPGWATRHGVKTGDVVRVLDVKLPSSAHASSHIYRLKINNTSLDAEASSTTKLTCSDADSPSRFALKGHLAKAFIGPIPGLWMKGMSAPVDLVFIKFGSMNFPLDPGKVLACYSAKPMGDHVKDENQLVYTAVGVFKQKNIPVGSPTWKKAWMATGMLLEVPAGWAAEHGIKVGNDVSLAGFPPN